MILSVLISLFSACGKVSESQNDATDVTEYISFYDDLNRRIVLKDKPVKVAALMGSLADIWYLSGGEICACVDDAWTDFDLPLKNAINIGKLHEPDLEALILSEPDLIIASSSLPSNIKKKEFLENSGIPVCFLNVNTFNDYLKILDIFTDITGRKDLYETNGLNTEERINEILAENKIDNLEENKKSVLFLRASSGYIRAKSSEGTVLGEMLKELGFVNIADNDETLLDNLSLESILLSDPYRIFIVQTGDDEEATKDNINLMMSENPAWYGLTAVKENRVHLLDKKLFNLKPNEKWDIAYETLCKIINEQ